MDKLKLCPFCGGSAKIALFDLREVRELMEGKKDGGNDSE